MRSGNLAGLLAYLVQVEKLTQTTAIQQLLLTAQSNAYHVVSDQNRSSSHLWTLFRALFKDSGLTDEQTRMVQGHVTERYLHVSFGDTLRRDEDARKRGAPVQQALRTGLANVATQKSQQDSGSAPAGEWSRPVLGAPHRIHRLHMSDQPC